MIRSLFLSVLSLHTLIFAELTLNITTNTYNGMFSPSHVCAIWLTDENDSFIKSLEVNASFREVNLRKWKSHSKSDKTDAITSATLHSHRTHNIVYDSALEDGTYKIWVEISENNTSLNESSWGGNAAFKFQIIDNELISMDLSDVTFKQHVIFKDVSLSYQGNSSTKVKTYSKEIITPNHFIINSFLYLNDINLKELTIFNTSGQKILTSDKNKVNISNLSKGFYFLKIQTKNRFFYKQIKIDK